MSLTQRMTAGIALLLVSPASCVRAGVKAEINIVCEISEIEGLNAQGDALLTIYNLQKKDFDAHLRIFNESSKLRGLRSMDADAQGMLGFLMSKPDVPFSAQIAQEERRLASIKEEVANSEDAALGAAVAAAVEQGVPRSVALRVARLPPEYAIYEGNYGFPYTLGEYMCLPNEHCDKEGFVLRPRVDYRVSISEECNGGGGVQNSKARYYHQYPVR